MAGPFVGALLGTIGTRPGSSDMTPYLTMRRMQIQAEEAARQQAAQQNQFSASLGLRKQEFAAHEKQNQADFEFRQQEAERAKSRYELEFLNREEQQSQQAEQQKAELDLRTRELQSRENERAVDTARQNAADQRQKKNDTLSSASLAGENLVAGYGDMGADWGKIATNVASVAQQNYPDDLDAQAAFMVSAQKASEQAGARKFSQEERVAVREDRTAGQKEKAEIDRGNADTRIKAEERQKVAQQIAAIEMEIEDLKDEAEGYEARWEAMEPGPKRDDLDLKINSIRGDIRDLSAKRRKLILGE